MSSLDFFQIHRNVKTPLSLMRLMEHRLINTVGFLMLLITLPLRP